MRALRAGPEGAMRAVVLIHHGPGLDAFIADRVERLGERGFRVVAPDLFHRQPDDGADATVRAGRLRDEDIIEDARTCLEELGPRDLSVVGFCMGGRGAYLLAGAFPIMWRRCAVFYGGNIFVQRGDGPTPFARTPEIRCPMIGFFGNDDTNPSPADVDAIDAELARCGVAHAFHRYDGAGHAFLNFTNERHRPAQAADAWAKLLAFLEAP